MEKLFILFVLLTFVNGSDRPNIVMIVADDMGFSDVSFHGSPQIPTPNIDALANEGVILNNYYVLPSCTPTRSAIMTGRYPIHTGMQSGTIYAANGWGLGLDEKLLPQYLKDVGYKTHAFGKWHLGFFSKAYTPTHRGFDSFYGFYGGQADYWDHSLASNGWQGLDLHDDNSTHSQTVFTQWGNYSSKMFAMEAIDRINHHDTKDPLFVYLAFQAVHSANMVEYPLQAPQAWVNKFSHIKHTGRRKYAAMMGCMDYWIGKVRSSLEARGMLDNTIIIFTSDNGGPANGLNMNWASNFPLRGTKTTVYEGGVRAAGCIWSKELSKAPRVSTDLMHVSDWLPTLLHVAGVDARTVDNLDGMDLWDSIVKGKQSPRFEVLVNIDPHVYNNAALRVGDWKIVNQPKFFDGWYAPPGTKNKKRKKLGFTSAEVQCPDPPVNITHCGGNQGKPCLFNLRDDPCEHQDLSQTYPIIYNLMLKRLDGYRRSMVKSHRTTFRDPRANPDRRQGVWLPWADPQPSANLPQSTAFKRFFDMVMPFHCQMKR